MNAEEMASIIDFAAEFPLDADESDEDQTIDIGSFTFGNNQISLCRSDKPMCPAPIFCGCTTLF